MSVEDPVQPANPDRKLNIAVSVWGSLVLAGLFVWAYLSDPAAASESVARQQNARVTGGAGEGNVSVDAILESGNLQSAADGTFDSSIFGYPILCAQLNTPLYGYSETVDWGKPINDSAEDIFAAMGDRVDPNSKVMVIKGNTITFRDNLNGAEYQVDANKTVFCRAKK